jgi:hypothetical protein
LRKFDILEEWCQQVVADKAVAQLSESRDRVSDQIEVSMNQMKSQHQQQGQGQAPQSKTYPIERIRATACGLGFKQ